jgi:protein TonB
MKTSVEFIVIPGFDEIVFEKRNKEYGAYILRRIYRRNVTIAVIFAVIIATLSIILPYLIVKSREVGSENKVRIVQNLVLSNIDPVEKISIPETPKPRVDMIQQAKYIPPVVVDSVKQEDFKFLTSDEAQIIVQNQEITDMPTEVPEEIVEEKEPEPFYKVEEPPMYPGGVEALLKYVYDNVVYPQIAIENNIQGRVTVKFCVTATGGVNQISILKGVDPEIDKEVIRVVSSVPPFKPGKQGGKPVPVWYILPVTFKLTTQ